VTDHLAYFGDFFATFCQLAAVPLPAHETNLDSVSFLPTLLDEPEEQKQHPYLYWELHGGRPRQAVRFGRFKAIRRPLGSGQVELYDLAADLGEQHNLAAANPEAVKRAKRMMDEAHRESPLWPDPRP
jgi:arylsulfatase A-like enzyme